jgi:hypothetical protein
MLTQQLPNHILDENKRVSLENLRGEIEKLEGCGGTGTCRRCEGKGEHLRCTHTWEECEACAGTGDCPCTYNMFAHERPVA